MQENPEDKISYYVLIRGIEYEAVKLASTRFDTRRGGADPRDQKRYVSIPIEPAQIDECLTWIKSNIEGRYDSVTVGVSAYTKLTWCEFIVLPEVVAAVTKHDAILKINFGSSATHPVTKRTS